MILIEGDRNAITQPIVASIGFYDGVHTGHRFLLEQIKQEALKDHISSGVITFRNHPRSILHKDYCPQLIDNFEERISKLEKIGIDYCIVLDFSPEMSNLSAFDFLKQLKDSYNIQTLYIGYDHRFGHNRSDGFNDYLRYGNILNIKIIKAAPFAPNKEHISSSAIRKLILEGEVRQAALLLGCPHSIKGYVVHGKQLGRQLGFPTANIEQKNREQIIPKPGAYAVRVSVNGILYNGMLNIGKRPTIDNDNHTSIEVHIFNFSENIYGSEIQIYFIDRLRDEIKLSGLEALTEQLEKDKEHALHILLTDANH